jgi:hypothetical protein
MSRYLLDTDTITLLQFGHAVVRNIAAHTDTDILLSTVSFEEQMRGWLGRLAKLAAPVLHADWHDRLVTRIFPVWRRIEMLPFFCLPSNAFTSFAPCA